MARIIRSSSPARSWTLGLALSLTFSLALAFLLAGPAAASEPAAARLHWSAGVDFTIGGVDFALGFIDSGRHHDRGHRDRSRHDLSHHDRSHHDRSYHDRSYHDRSYYYVTAERLGHSGLECGSACFLRDGLYYHHPDCPLVLEHFDRHGFDPYPAWSSLPDGGLRYYPHHHGSLHDDHGRRHGDRRGRGRDDDDHWDDSDGRRHRGGRDH